MKSLEILEEARKIIEKNLSTLAIKENFDFVRQEFPDRCSFEELVTLIEESDEETGEKIVAESLHFFLDTRGFNYDLKKFFYFYLEISKLLSTFGYNLIHLSVNAFQIKTPTEIEKEKKDYDPITHWTNIEIEKQKSDLRYANKNQDLLIKILNEIEGMGEEISRCFANGTLPNLEMENTYKRHFSLVRKGFMMLDFGMHQLHYNLFTNHLNFVSLYSLKEDWEGKYTITFNEENVKAEINK